MVCQKRRVRKQQQQQRHSRYECPFVPLQSGGMRFCMSFCLLLSLTSLVCAHASPLRGSTSSNQKEDDQQHYRELNDTPEAVGVAKPRDDRIVGGTDADTTKYPFYVHTISGELCGGTLIAPDIVLTAAHCQEAFDKKFVLINSEDLYGDSSDQEERINVQSTYPHEDYTEEPNTNDIMLVKLSAASRSAKFAQWNRNPSIPSATEQKLTVIGYGRVAEGGDVSQTLQQVTVPVVSGTVCQGQYDSVNPAKQLCASAPGKDACAGDSGGPLLVTVPSTSIGVSSSFTQVGVVSYGTGCARADFSGVYTRLSAYADWIDAMTCKLSAHASTLDICGGGASVPENSKPTPAPVAPKPVPVPATPKPPTRAPVSAPTRAPVSAPTRAPVSAPTRAPISAPTRAPVSAPTRAPIHAPTRSPTRAPVSAPTRAPIHAPTRPPTRAPVSAPTRAPIHAPTRPPTRAPVSAPTRAPVHAPTRAPTRAPVHAPTRPPTRAPVSAPTRAPVMPPKPTKPTN